MSYSLSAFYFDNAYQEDEEELPRYWLDDLDCVHDRDNHNRFASRAEYDEQEREFKSNIRRF
jgi:hypothetical protein